MKGIAPSFHCPITIPSYIILPQNQKKLSVSDQSVEGHIMEYPLPIMSS